MTPPTTPRIAAGRAMTAPRTAAWSAFEVIENAYTHTASADALIKWLWEYGYEIRPIAAPPPASDTGLREHKPRWEQDRDDPVGMWTCGCGKTFAPDDFEGYWRHLAAAAPAPALDSGVNKIDPERLARALQHESPGMSDAAAFYGAARLQAAYEGEGEA